MRAALRIIICLLVFVLSSLCAATAEGEGGNFGDMAPDFPPGTFSDGKQYHLKDFRGQVVVLFFYEQKCPTCRATIPARNKTVKQFQGKPVSFIGVGAGDSPEEVQAYIRGTNLAMPVFADTRSAMEKAYGFRISLRNIYQVRVIGPDGRVVGYDMKPATIEQALTGPSNDVATEQQTQGTTGAEAGDLPPTITRTITTKKTAGRMTRNDLIGLHNEAVTAIENHQSPVAIEKLNKILKIDPNYRLAKENLEIAYTNYGVDLFTQGKLAEAEPVLKQALALAQQLYKPDHEHLRQAKENLASVLHGLGRSAEADALVGNPGGSASSPPTAAPIP